jgi:hypothetical protein
MLNTDKLVDIKFSFFEKQLININNVNYLIEEYHLANELYSIIEFIGKIIETKSVLFSVKVIGDQNKLVCENPEFNFIWEYLFSSNKNGIASSIKVNLIKQSFPVHNFHPNIQLFFNNINSTIIGKVDPYVDLHSKLTHLLH